MTGSCGKPLTDLPDDLKPRHCYRVYMKDGYAGLYDGATPEEAKKQAIEYATKSIVGAAMTPREKRLAVAVDTCEQLN